MTFVRVFGEVRFSRILAVSGYGPRVAAYGRLWPHMAAHGRTWPHMAAYGHILAPLDASGGILGTLGGSGGVSGNLWLPFWGLWEPLGQFSLFSDLSNLSAPEKISISPQRGAIFWRWRFERFSIFPDNGRLPFESEHIAAEG